MRISKMSIVLVLMVALTVPVIAQRSPGSYSIGGFGGLIMPQSPKVFKDMFKSGIGFGGEIKYNINEKTSLVGAFSYLPLKFNADEIAKMIEAESGETGLDVSIDGGGININAITADILLYLSQPEASAGFYVTAGGGYYMMKPKNIEKVELVMGGQTIDITDEFSGGNDTKSDNKFGINGGLGLEIKAGEKLSIFAEGKYHYIFTKEEADATADTKGKTQFITVMGGLRFSL